MDELRERLIQLRTDISSLRLRGDIGKMSPPHAQAATASTGTATRIAGASPEAVPRLPTSSNPAFLVLIP